MFRVLQMNIYFCGSIRGGRQDVAIYQQIVTCLKPFGKVLTEHVAFPELELGKEPKRAGVDQQLDNSSRLQWKNR